MLHNNYILFSSPMELQILLSFGEWNKETGSCKMLTRQ